MEKTVLAQRVDLGGGICRRRWRLRTRPPFAPARTMLRCTVSRPDTHQPHTSPPRRRGPPSRRTCRDRVCTAPRMAPPKTYLHRPCAHRPCGAGRSPARLALVVGSARTAAALRSMLRASGASGLSNTIDVWRGRCRSGCRTYRTMKTLPPFATAGLPDDAGSGWWVCRGEGTMAGSDPGRTIAMPFFV